MRGGNFRGAVFVCQSNRNSDLEIFAALPVSCADRSVLPRVRRDKSRQGGKWLRSFVLHPFVPYAALLSGWFMISQTIERVSGSRIRIALRFRDVYIWIALLLIVVNCLVKNLALFVWHVDLLA